LAREFDARLFDQIVTNNFVFGFVRSVEADTAAEARSLAEKNFQSGDFDLTHRGEDICEQLLTKHRTGRKAS